MRVYFPCTDDDSASGSQYDGRRSFRYLANAINLDTGKVEVVKLPKDLANRLYLRAEKRGTITDRDCELSRDGEQLNTVYDAEFEAPSKVDLSRYKTIDLMETLQNWHSSVFGGDESENGQVVADAPRKQKAKPKPVVEVEDDDDLEELDPTTALEADDEVPFDNDDDLEVEAVEEALEDPETEVELEDEEEEDSIAVEGDGDDDDYYTPEQLEAMDLEELQEVADQLGVRYSPRTKKDVLLNTILATAEEDE
jgi:hypothetical protein